MSSAPLVPSEVEEYVAAVRRALADLPSSERDDLLAEVEASLLEATEEGAGPIGARLGAPEQFAAELRAAAGLHESAPPMPRESDLGRRLRAARGRALAHPAVTALRRLGRELAPIWWVLRAYLAVGAIACALGSAWSTRLPIVPRFGSAETGLTAIGVAVVVSVWLGLELRRHGSPFPRLAVIVNMSLLLAAIPVVAQVTDTSSGYQSLLARANTAEQQLYSGLIYQGVEVDNIYPYSRDGRLLHDVLLYDTAGRALDLPAFHGLDPNRRYVSNGHLELLNAFPIRYYEPGTRLVLRPNAAPYVKVRPVLTPPLTSPRANAHTSKTTLTTRATAK